MTESELKERLVIERILLDIEFRSLIFWDNPQAKRVMQSFRYREPDVTRRVQEILEDPEEEDQEGSEPRHPGRSPRRAAEDQEVESVVLDADMEQSA